MCLQNKRRYLCHCVKFEFFDQCVEFWGSNKRCPDIAERIVETDIQYCRNHTVDTGEPMYRRRAGQARGGRGGAAARGGRGGAAARGGRGGRRARQA